jgi:L-ascorbate metabolism protein UlaG (beta-lactamase superfamily)
MVITYHGIESFRIQLGNTVLALNPVSKESKEKSASFGADVILVSLNHPDMNGVEAVSRGGKNAFVVTGPGEYEVGGVAIRGFKTVSKYNEEEKINTIYIINLEDMKLCFLGALGADDIDKDAKESLDDIDVLFLPIGGDGVLNYKSAHGFGIKLEPKIIIPMHYDEKSLKSFLKEEGESNGKPTEKLTLKKRDVVGKEGDIVVLSPQ